MAYHHGALREAILDAAADAIEREGVAALSLRALAREVGVTHTAPRHHFGSKRGVLTALAAQGYRLLAADVRRANEQGDFLESGVAYTEFSRTHAAHFSVMFRPDLVEQDDEELRAALDDLYAALTGGVRTYAGSPQAEESAGGPVDVDVASLALAAWSMVHGFATLARSGNFRLEEGQTEADLARRTLQHLSP
jgi:AcrR family transcriptional regulator